VEAPVDVSIILTAHNEGLLIGPTARSALAAVEFGKNENISSEIVVVLDRADTLTSEVLHGVFGDRARYLETDEGDPGQARNRGIEVASGRFSTFLDGDDLWSENWLVASCASAIAKPGAIWHCACIFRFGGQRHLYWHISSETGLFDPEYLDWTNYWDAMSFALTDIYRAYPFRKNMLGQGFGHEDWHWNRLTIARGLHHNPVPETIHFKRSRPNSQMSRVEQAGGVAWPVDLPLKISSR
jgi:glycosyltransferase involved in cell wall biosynthesis